MSMLREHVAEGPSGTAAQAAANLGPRIGSDLLARQAPTDARYLGIDLAARGRDFATWFEGSARVPPVASLTLDDRGRVRALATLLRRAGPDEIDRFAVDTLHLSSFPETTSRADRVTTMAYAIWGEAAGF